MSQTNADNPQLSLALSQVLYDSNPNDPNEMASRLSRMTNARDKQAADVSLAQTGLAWERMRDYNAATTLIGQMNEAYNANKFVGDALLKEETRVARINNELQKELYKLQQNVLFTTYQRQERQLKTAMALATACVASIVAVLVAMMRQDLLHWSIVITATVVLVALYLLAMVSLTRRAARRRNYHWRQFYWNVALDKEKQFTGPCQRARSEDSVAKPLRRKMRKLAQDIRESFASSQDEAENGGDKVEPFAEQQDSWGGNVVGSEASMTTTATKRKRQKERNSDEEKELNKHIRSGFAESLRKMAKGVPPSELVLPTNNMRERLREFDPSLSDRYEDVLTAVQSDVADFVDLPKPLRDDISALMRDIWASGSLASSAALVRDAFVEALRQLRAGMPPEKANLPSDLGIRTLEDHDDELSSRYATLLSRVREAHADSQGGGGGGGDDDDDEDGEEDGDKDEDEDGDDKKKNKYVRVEVPDDLHQGLVDLSRSMWQLDSISSGTVRGKFVSALERMAQGAGPSRVAMPGISERRAMRKAAPGLYDRYKSLVEQVRDLHADADNPVLEEYGISASDFPLVLSAPRQVKKAARTIKAYLMTVAVAGEGGSEGEDDDKEAEEKTDLTAHQRGKLIDFLDLFTQRQEHTDLSIVSHDEASSKQDVLDKLTKSNKRIKQAMDFFYALVIDAQSDAFKKRFRNNAAQASSLLRAYEGKNIIGVIGKILNDDSVSRLFNVPNAIANKAKATKKEVKGRSSFVSPEAREIMMKMLDEIASGAVDVRQLSTRLKTLDKARKEAKKDNKKKTVMTEDVKELSNYINEDIVQPLFEHMMQGGQMRPEDMLIDDIDDIEAVEREDDDDSIADGKASRSDFPVTLQVPREAKSIAKEILAYLSSSAADEELDGVDNVDAFSSLMEDISSNDSVMIEFDDAKEIDAFSRSIGNYHKLNMAFGILMLVMVSAQPESFKERHSDKMQQLELEKYSKRRDGEGARKVQDILNMEGANLSMSQLSSA